MILIDSNIIIYSAQDIFAYLRPLVSDLRNNVSVFSKVEVLGYPALIPKDKNYFESVFAVLNVYEISESVINRAILLKQVRKISSGDSIIAATALQYDCELYTRNVSDFNWIDGLKIVNPIK